MPDLLPVDPTLLRLPECPIPRPGDTVCWYAGARLVRGELKGHDIAGRPLIVNQFGNPAPRASFDEIRLLDPFERRGPNWMYLPSGGLIVRPSAEQLDSFRSLLRSPVPPGPSALDLAGEIWNRGFEVYLVGGTVRDVLRGAASNDIDFVTTMPLARCHALIRPMFRYNPSAAKTRGFIRIGGTPASGDPFIDLKVFSDSLPGTEDATFGVGFNRDVAHRDFACNAVYFDPINEVIVDPTGRGIEDAMSNTLSLICASGDPHQHAQVFIRFFKFCHRGFQPTPDTVVEVCTSYVAALAVMKQKTRVEYMRTQVLGKCAATVDQHEVVDQVARLMDDFGLGAVWAQYFAPHVTELCNAN